MLVTGAFLAIFVGLVHSYLGERYILTRLFKRELPKLLGSDWFTKRVLRFAWHLTTVAWWGFAVILIPILFVNQTLFFETFFFRHRIELTQLFKNMLICIF